MQEPNEITVHVAENGDDGNDGSRDAPFASVHAALKTLKGTPYDQAVIIVSGTITEVAEIAAMIAIVGKYPPLLFKGESQKRKGVLDAAGLEKRVLFISGGNTVTLGPDLVLRGGSTKQEGGSGVNILGGKLILDGAKVMENKAEFGLCGGIYVGKDSSFVMKSGCIMKNSTLFNGGGVFPDEGGSFVMHGGIITENTALIAGAGVFVGVEGSFTMYDGVIDRNTAGGEKVARIGDREIPSGKGGGVYVCSRGVFTMHAGEIRNNRALSFNENEDSGSGGGVFVERGGACTQEDGKIFKNGSMNFGAGVFTRGNYTIKNGRISNNISRMGGGGVCAAGKESLFVLERGEITTNYGGSGGAVCIKEEGVSRMENGIIAGNTGTLATTLFIDGIVSMLDGVIQGEDKTKLPDVQIDNNGKFFLAGGTFKAKVAGEGAFEDLRKKQPPGS